MSIQDKIDNYLDEAWAYDDIKRSFDRFTKKVDSKVDKLKKQNIKGNKPFKGFNSNSMEKKWDTLNDQLYKFLSKYFE